MLSYLAMELNYTIERYDVCGVQFIDILFYPVFVEKVKWKSDLERSVDDYEWFIFRQLLLSKKAFTQLYNL
ncbi:hypothetical protein L1887_20870 [Cichorium endivia]|nr:hypothetical protein L1887_20870 [Cichorium endivia]